MNTPCPHCSAVIEIDPAIHATLAGQSHFACPACQGAVPVPALEGKRIKLNPSPGVQARRPDQPTHHPKAVSTSSRKTNRNFLILGATALLVLGGIAFMLASKRSGDTHVTTQNIDNDIINNSYFQNLIATGVTTREELEQLGAILSYGDGFIGVSGDSVAWEAAAVLARKAGAEVLDPSRGGAAAREKLIPWLAENLATQLAAPAWVSEGGQPRILDGAEILAVTGTDRPRKVLVRWQPGGNQVGNRSGAATTSDVNPWRGFDPGPLVFEDTLTKPDALKKTTVVEGQYSVLELVSGVGLRMPPGHTWSMVWPKAVMGDSCRLEFEVEALKDSHIGWVLKGSGLGNSNNTGIGLSINRGELTIRREGSQWKTKKLPSPLEEGKSVTVQTDIRDGHIAVRINGTLAVSGSAQEGLSGPLHGWCGISGINCIYRNLRIWSSEKNQTYQPQLSPPVTVAPRPNGEEIFKYSEPDGPLGQNWDVYSHEFVHAEGGALLLSAHYTNGWPRVIPKVEFPENFAVEFIHQFPKPQTHNLGFFIAKSPTLPRSLKEVDEIWQVSLPGGDGTHQVRWASRKTFTTLNEDLARWFLWGGTQLFASNAYFAPIQNREYLIRLELMGRNLRVFLDGGLLMETTRPDDVAISNSPTWIGFGQFYSSSKIKSLRVFHFTGNE